MVSGGGRGILKLYKKNMSGQIFVYGKYMRKDVKGKNHLHDNPPFHFVTWKNLLQTKAYCAFAQLGGPSQLSLFFEHAAINLPAKTNLWHSTYVLALLLQVVTSRSLHLTPCSTSMPQLRFGAGAYYFNQIAKYAVNVAAKLMLTQR